MTLGKPFYAALGASLAVILFVIPPIAGAQSACKGLEQTACTNQTSSCTWVGSYTRSDGTKVSGYCRSKGNRSTNTSTSSSPKATSKDEAQ